MRLHNRGAGLRRRLEGLKPGVIGGLLALLMLVAAACDDKAQPAGPTATGESPGTGAQTQQIPSTPPSSEEGTPPVSRAFVNACTYRAPAPTPTPDLTTPTATPFSNTTPIPYPTESPSAEVVAYPDLPPPALPASVEAWRDAVVHVSVERASGRTRDQQGLVVADGAVLTVLDHRWEIVSLSVEVSGRGEFTAELERFDPRTGAALLTIEAEDLTVAPGERGRAMAHPSVLRATLGDFMASRSFLAGCPLGICQPCCWTPRSICWSAPLQISASPPLRSPTTGRTEPRLRTGR